MNQKKSRIILIDRLNEHNDKIQKVAIAAEDLSRYVMKFDIDSGIIVMTYHDMNKPLRDERPIRKILKRTYDGSAANRAFKKVLDNYHLKAIEDYVEYNPRRNYVVTDPMLRKDLTDVANNIKMPEDFRRFFFKVHGGGKILEINTVVSQADIDELGLDTAKMDEYLSGLPDFKLIDKDAGWQ